MISMLKGGRWLLPGDHPMSFEEIRGSDLILGPPDKPNWDRPWRLHLLANLELLANELWSAGIQEIFLCGSFVEAKERPSDVDGYFICDRHDYKTRKLHERLNALNQFQAWTWRDEHKKPDGEGNLKSLLWHHYRCELYPYYGHGQGNFVGRDGTNLSIPEFYRRTRCESFQRGVVKLVYQ